MDEDGYCDKIGLLDKVIENGYEVRFEMEKFEKFLKDGNGF